MINDEKEFVILWEAPKIIPPEFRLYYDDKGKVICYCGDKSVQGNIFIVIDARTFAEGRNDIRVVDGKIVTASANAVVCKLMPDYYGGMTCHPEDVSVLVDDTYLGDTIKWKLNIYEL